MRASAVHEEIEVVGFGHAPQDGVVGRLLALFDLLELDVRRSRRLADRALQKARRHEMRAGTGGQVAPAREQAQGELVDLQIAAAGLLHRRPALGKGRRVQDHQVEGAALFRQPLLVARERRQVVEDVGAGEAHPVGKPVELGVTARKVDRRLRHVDAAHEFRIARRRVQAEGAYVGKAVEHALAGRQLAHSAPVVLLVQEEARFLAVEKVDVVGDAILAHDDALGRIESVDPCRPGSPVPPAFLQIKAFVAAGRRVVTLVDAAHLLPVGAQNLQDHRVEHGAQAVHAHRAHLGHEHIFVTVDDEPGDSSWCRARSPAGRAPP